MPRPKKANENENEPDSKYTAWILAAIAKVKGQKQRPNEERITHVLESTYGVDAQTVVEQLDLCVKAGLIIRGEFKGQSSYKDPNVSTPSGVKRSPQMPTDLRKYVQKAILHEGVDGSTVAAIEKYLREKYPEKAETMNDLTMAIKHAIQRGVNSGRFVKVGRYVKVKERPHREPKLSSAQKEMLREKLRPKKPVAQPSPVCGFCLGTVEKNRDGEPEELISCADCGNSGHPSCLKYSPELTVKIQSERWQCIECKVCSVCVSAGNADNLLFCDACDKGFHMECLEPPMSEMPSGSWICFMCTSKPSPRKRKMITTPPRRKIRHILHDESSGGSKSAMKRKLQLSLLNQDVTPKRRSGKIPKFSPKSPTQKRPPLPPGVTEEDYALFKKAQEKANSELTSQPTVVQTSHSRSPPFIQFGPYDITTWYSSPYPQEYARLPKLYLCEFCLKYMKSMNILQRHKTKCGWFHPPANEIYRHDDISVFEVDGAVNKIYCQNLCLLAKLFLDHKTLYYDVEPFLFYVLTLNDRKGCHLVGYFSKEKACQQKYNLSCIMTMPHYQRKGYGRLLIDFSYLLSRIEGQSGSPEKPLSDLGLLTYRSYWRSVILEYFGKHKESQVTIRDVSRSTGMDPHDIAATLQQLNMVKRKDGKVVICLNRKSIDEHVEKVSSQKRLELDSDRLRWTPLVHAAAVVSATTSAVIGEEKAQEETGKGEVKEEEVNGDVDVVGTEQKSSLGTPISDKEEGESGVVEQEGEEGVEAENKSSSEDEEEIIPRRKRTRKAIDESESEEENKVGEKRRKDSEDESNKSDEESENSEDDNTEQNEEDQQDDDGEDEKKTSSASDNDDSDSSSSSSSSSDDDDTDDDDDSSSSSSSDSSSSSASSWSSVEQQKTGKDTSFPDFNTQSTTMDPVLPGLKDTSGELAIGDEKSTEETSGVFGLAQQESAFDLDDAPSLQDFLGGDINMTASDDLAAESLLGTDSYYESRVNGAKHDTNNPSP